MSRLIDADALKFTEYLGMDEPVISKSEIDAAPTVEPKRGEWISVKDRLPEYNPAGTAKAYWVAYDTNKGKHIQIAIYSDYKFATTTELPPCVTWRDYEYHKIKNVTHWMPLPEPPQEDKP
jgi:hypothetical protein